MGLRDIVLLVTIYGSIPFILRKPFVGILVWYWLSLMNPHRISWVLTGQPFAQLIAITMLASLLMHSDEKKRIPGNSITFLLAGFWVWILATTLFSLYPDLAWPQLTKVSKILLTTFIAIAVVNSKERLEALVVVVSFSIAFYGFKGGAFTLMTGGGYRVWGPTGTFIGGNNEIGLALIMTIPLLFYLRSLLDYKRLRQLMLVGIVLCLFAILGTQSRGALVGVVAMGLTMILKSDNRPRYLLLVLVMVPLVLWFMPETWYDRMSTISSFEQDGSAMGD